MGRCRNTSVATFALLWLAVLLALVTPSNAFYLPGVAPKTFKFSDLVNLWVNKLDSSESVLQYDYYHFDFCQPEEVKNFNENLGQVVFGDRLKSSDYELKFQENEHCKVLCIKQYDIERDGDLGKIKQLQLAIREQYFVHAMVDNLPVIQRHDNEIYSLGYRLGHLIPEQNTYILNNHITFNIEYHPAWEEGDAGAEGGRIVGVYAVTRSMTHSDKEVTACGQAGNKMGCASCDTDTEKGPQWLVLDKTENNKMTVMYTYSVEWKKREDVTWRTRWEPFLKIQQDRIHWYSIVNSVVIVLFLSGMVFMILLRTIHRDLARYNAADLSAEEAQEEFGWKLVHGDVFRSPSYGMLLSVLAGSGVQVMLMLGVTIAFAMLGFLSPANGGSLAIALLVLFVGWAAPAGYVSARIYKMIGGEKWKTNVIMTAFLFPGFMFLLFFILNIALWSNDSSNAVPALTTFELMLLWFCISVPLCFLGAFLGFKKEPISMPVRTNQIPRQIPEQPFYMRAGPSILTGGILPFGSIFIELYFILASIWHHRIYYIFGFLFLVFVILIVTTAEVAILLCYFHLCAEDWRWWWRSFLTGGATAFYFMLYSIVYYWGNLDMEGFTNGFLYFGYMSMLASLLFVMCGAVGFIACLAFVLKIYAMVKID
eukprot:Clim_evm28s2 gene=Clim_evmTU28s2